MHASCFRAAPNQAKDMTSSQMHRLITKGPTCTAGHHPKGTITPQNPMCYQKPQTMQASRSRRYPKAHTTVTSLITYVSVSQSSMQVSNYGLHTTTPHFQKFISCSHAHLETFNELECDRSHFRLAFARSCAWSSGRRSMSSCRCGL